MKQEFDCTKCGACCIAPHWQDSFCDLTHEEYDRLSPQFRAKSVKDYSLFYQAVQGSPCGALRTKFKKMKSGPLKGLEVCMCCQLDGTIFRKVKCRIYSTRPSICKRACKPGDRICKQIRKELQQKVAKA